MPSSAPEAVRWRYAASDAELAAWARDSERTWVAVEYRLANAPPGEWWRVRVVTHDWLRGMLALPYTAHALPALLIVPDGSIEERSAAVSRLLERGQAQDLTRVAERVVEPSPLLENEALP